MTETVPLAQLVELQRGRSYKSRLLDKPGPTLIGLGTIARNGGFRGDSLRTYGGDSPAHILLQSGDIYLSLKDVTSSADLLGAVARVPATIDSGRLTQDTVRLDILSDRIAADYLYLALQTPHYRAYCKAHGTGTTNLDLSRRDFLSYEVSLPSLPDQHRIAEVLGALDDKIAANHSIERRSHELAEAHYASLAREATGVGTVGSLLALKYGKSLPEAKRTPGSVEVFGSGGVVGSHDSALVEGPGVVVGRKGTAGAVHWAPHDFFPIDTTFYVEPLSRETSLQYCYFALRSLQLGRDNSDSAVPGLNRNTAEATPIRMPEPGNIRSFTEQVAPLMKTIAVRTAESKSLAATRDALLPALMSGRLRVRDAERQVEEVV